MENGQEVRQTEIEKNLSKHVLQLLGVKACQFVMNPRQYLDEFNIATLKPVLPVSLREQHEQNELEYVLRSRVADTVFTTPVIFSYQILYGSVEGNHAANCSSLRNIVDRPPSDNHTSKSPCAVKKCCPHLCFIVLSCFKVSTSSNRAVILRFALAWGDVWTQLESDDSKEAGGGVDALWFSDDMRMNNRCAERGQEGNRGDKSIY